MNMLRASIVFAALLLLAQALGVTDQAHAQQQTEIERLELLVRSRQQRGERDSVLVRLLLDLAQEYRRGNPERALNIAREAESLARSINDNPGLANSFTSIGITYAGTGAWVRALNHFLKALQLKEELGDQQGMAALLSNIGVLHGKLNDEERALRYHQRAAKYFQETSDVRGLSYSYNNIGVIHMDRGEYDKALQHFVASLDLKKDLRDVQGLASTHLNIGICYFLQGVLARAEENFQRAAELYTNIGDKTGQAETYLRMGMLQQARKQYPAALQLGERALALATAINARAVERNALKLCADANAALGNHAPALDYYRRHTALKDSLFNEESSKIINDMTANYELAQREKSDKENELLKRDQQIKQMELERRAAQLKEQDQSIELLNKERTISALKLKEQEAQLITQRLEAEQRKDEIALLQKDRELLARDRALKDAELQRQVSLRNSVIIGSFFLVIILFLLGVSYRLKRRTALIFQQKSEELEAANADIRKHEELLQDQAIQIERKNEELTRQNAMLEQLNNEKNELLGIVSHDLRNPIGGILMVAEAMTEEGRSPEYLRAKAQSIHETAGMVITLVRNLLDINRLESGRMQLDQLPIDVRPLLMQLVHAHARWAERKHIRIDVDLADDGTLILGDKGAMSQILDNLISNAIKYTALGSTILLRMRRADSRIVLEVWDEGEGMTEEDEERMYQKFAKLSAKPTGGESSTGLGLSIVKKLTETMGGAVNYRRREERGSVFTVDLPAASLNGSSHEHNLADARAEA